MVLRFFEGVDGRMVRSWIMDDLTCPTFCSIWRQLGSFRENLLGRESNVKEKEIFATVFAVDRFMKRKFRPTSGSMKSVEVRRDGF